jgi:hypothetical protein
MHLMRRRDLCGKEAKLLKPQGMFGLGDCEQALRRR